MRFTKMEGLGNDFVVVEPPFDPGLVAAICDRRRGVGADGVLEVSATAAGARMRYWNADGSPAEMCGNGLRCVARFAVDRGVAAGPDLVVETAVGPLRATVSAGSVTVELGAVEVADEVDLAGRRWRLASVGNPHAVTFVDDPGACDVDRIGREMQEAVPGGVNAGFVAVSDAGITLRVFERGVGETLACGTGAAAAAAVARARGVVGDDVTVDLPGGRAIVSFRDGSAWLTGPASYVFEGDYPYGV